jgi:hypothetical protein
MLTAHVREADVTTTRDAYLVAPTLQLDTNFKATNNATL